MVDTWNALPSAILMYSVGICFVRELLAEEDYWLSEQEAMEKARLEHEAKLRKQRNRIMFELEVLQGRSNVRLITREEGGVSKIYAIFWKQDKRHQYLSEQKDQNSFVFVFLSQESQTATQLFRQALQNIYNDASVFHVVGGLATQVQSQPFGN